MDECTNYPLYRIAIVEDDQRDAEQLQSMLNRYSTEMNIPFEISLYQNAVVFLTNYRPHFDVIFTDIDMPLMNGLDGAERLRQIDKTTLLIFTTNLGHLALRGYEVEAFDFLVKPLQYPSLRLKLGRAISRLKLRTGDRVVISSNGTKLYVELSNIHYVEVSDHQLIYHCVGGNYPAHGTLTKIREQLEPQGFSLCNNCYLVNLKYVRKVQDYRVMVGQDWLQISHPRRKAFLDTLNNYIGG